jgi:hypothetical protein
LIRATVFDHFSGGVSEVQSMIENSLEKFIYVHYYGYTKLAENRTEVYNTKHHCKIHDVLI